MTLALLSSAIIMAFLGSWHCGVMCGPLSCNFKRTNHFFSYHIGRLISYLIMGAVLFSGIHYFTDAQSRPLKVAGGFIFGSLFILFGLWQLDFFKNKKIEFKIYKFQIQFFDRHKKTIQRFPIVLGLLTGLFPCSWLYSFLLLSTQMQNQLGALILIFIFWLAALPAFFVVTKFMQNLIKSSPISYQKISAVVLILAGALSIFGHWAEILFL